MHSASQEVPDDDFKFEIPEDQPVPELNRAGMLDKVKEFFSHEPQFYIDNYPMECCFLFALLIYAINFFFGKEQNNKFAIEARNAFFEPLQQQFSHLGVEDRPDSYALMQKSYSQYSYYATGRKGVLFAELNVFLKRRHCLVTSLYDVINGVTD